MTVLTRSPSGLAASDADVALTQKRSVCWWVRAHS